MERARTAGEFQTWGLLAFVFLAIVTSGCANTLLLHPSRQPVRQPGIERRVIERVEGDLEVWVARSPGAAVAPIGAAVLAFAGNADRAERIAASVAGTFGARPVEVWAVNFPGYGGSEGEADLAAIPDAALATYDALAHHAVETPILCWGESIGTSAALCVAAQRDVAGLVLRNPPPLRRLILVRHGWWNLWLLALPTALQVPVALNALDTAPEIDAPAVFAMSRADRVVPYAYQRLVFDAFAGPKEAVVLTRGHNDRMDAEERRRFAAAIDRLFARLGDGIDREKLNRWRESAALNGQDG